MPIFLLSRSLTFAQACQDDLAPEILHTKEGAYNIPSDLRY